MGTGMKSKKKTKRQIKARPVTLPINPWDEGAAGRANRIGLVQEDATDLDPETGKPTPNPNGVKRMRRVDMLEVWHRKGVISTAGYNAGEKLRDAFDKTQMGASINMASDRVDSSPKPDHAVTIQIDRISRFAALNKLVAPEDRAVIDTCIIGGHSPAYVTDRYGRRPYYGPGHAAGLIHVRDALDRLAKRMG